MTVKAVSLNYWVNNCLNTLTAADFAHLTFSKGGTRQLQRIIATRQKNMNNKKL
jgi:hypothetical protein